MKHRFKIIWDVNLYDLKTNARIVAGLCALHNFICCHEPDDVLEPWDGEEEEEGEGDTAATGVAAVVASSADSRQYVGTVYPAS